MQVNPDVAGEERLDAIQLPEDLVGDSSVGLVALARGAELDEVMDLAQVPGEERTLPVRQR